MNNNDESCERGSVRTSSIGDAKSTDKSGTVASSDFASEKRLDENLATLIVALKREHVVDYLNLLSQLSDIGDASAWTEEKRNSVFDAIDGSEHTQIFVAVDCASGRLLGAATVLMEQKFLHGGARVAHIEDVVVDKQSRGLGLGKRLLLHCVSVARAVGAYKTILNCEPKLESFYAACGFRRSALQMRCDHKL